MPTNSTELAERTCFFGASPDTGNLGVSALCVSTIEGLTHRWPDATITVFDYGRGCGAISSDRPTVRRAGAMLTRRWFRPESYFAIETALRTHLPISGSAREIAAADTILDISGGDSFTDLYGPRRLKSVAWPKLLALRLRKPLILLPQTYGPFSSPEALGLARRIVRGATMAWARDERSFGVLRELLGDAFEPDRHRCGVDVAFLLPVREPQDAQVPDRLRQWLAAPDPAAPLAGVNISGLLYNSPEKARSQYGFLADYGALTRDLVLGLIERGARVVLVPHVVTPPGHYESDIAASEALVGTLPDAARERIAISPAYADPREVKWLIGRCDWFCGTRMHATIAGLSQGVPTAAIAYSIKTQGVFETCGQGAQVADPRHSGTEEVVNHLLRSFDDRADAGASLSQHLPRVRAVAEEQMDAVVECVTNLSGGVPAAHRG